MLLSIRAPYIKRKREKFMVHDYLPICKEDLEKRGWLYYRKANRCIAVSGSCIVISLPLAA